MFPAISEDDRIRRLELPSGRLRMVLDTDTYNEIDDQYALVYALLSPERLKVEAIYAAPFYNDRSEGPGHGMELSFEEIERLLSKMGKLGEYPVLKGATEYLDKNNPVSNPAVEDLITRARASSSDDPLYVVAIGAITNIAVALLLAPDIINSTVLVWLGGHALDWPHTSEFNLQQDVPAAQVVLDCGVPLVLIPCMGVTSHLHSTVPEIERYVEPCGAIGAFLAQRYKEYSSDHLGWSKVIWDMATIAYLLDNSWTPNTLIHSPRLTSEKTWSIDQRRHLIRYVYYVQRDPIFKDFFQKLAGFAKD
jgi:inosine-uridine nucleoside N-ribohydrolase